jgi:DnaJ family protein C protein 28
MSERDIEEEIMIRAQQNRKLARYMSSTQDLVEEQIRKAQERGDFDHLEGAGKPLNLYENPYEPVELRMAFKILKENDFAPYWIELGKEIDAALDKLQQEIKYFKRYTELFWADKHDARAKQRYQSKKVYFYDERKRDLEKIDKKILDYNLHCPTFRQGRPNLDIAKEMEQIINVIENIIAGHQQP